MTQMATITGKRQLTIPSRIYHDLNLQVGQKLVISSSGNSIIIKPALSLIENLAGSLSLPPKYKKTPLNQIILQSKQEHFQKK